MPRKQESTPDRFGGLTVDEQTDYERHRLRVHLSYGIGVVAGLSLLVIVLSACVLAVEGRFALIGPLLVALGPFLLPILGGIVGFAFGRGGRAGAGG